MSALHDALTFTGTLVVPLFNWFWMAVALALGAGVGWRVAGEPPPAGAAGEAGAKR